MIQPVNYTALLNPAALNRRPSPTFAVAAKATDRKNQGKPVYDFCLGQPAEAAPDYVRQALLDAIKDDTTWAQASKYPPVSGMKPLKDNIIYKFDDENGLAYKANEILVTNGGKQAIYNALSTTLEKGDKVLIPDPSWVSYADIVKATGAEAVPIRTNKDFKFNAEALRHYLDDTSIKWLVLNSPSNPTGATYSKEEMEAIAGVILAANEERKKAGKAPVMVLSDDIYEHMVYDSKLTNDKGVSCNVIMANPEMKPYTVIVNGIAKAFSMTGHRVGYAAGPAELIKAMEALQGEVTSGVSALEELAAAAALDPKYKQEREAFFASQRERYKKRLAVIDGTINKDDTSSVSAVLTPGAFYAMLDVSTLCAHLPTASAEEQKLRPTERLANLLIDKYGVALVPGDPFYERPGQDGRSFLRMSYATDEGTIQKGLELIKEAEKGLVPEAKRIKSLSRAA